MRVHRVLFTVHTRETAYMVFINSDAYTLPSLFSFAIYFTHVNSSPEHTDMEGLHWELSTRYQDCDFDIRFDVYFLPGASHEDCICHHSGKLEDAAPNTPEV